MRVDMTRFVLLSVFTAVTTLLVAASQGLAPEERSRALHDPHDSLWQPAPSMYRVRIETTKGIILLHVTRALAQRGADRFYHLLHRDENLGGLALSRVCDTSQRPVAA
jgi:hypothetical protein